MTEKTIIEIAKILGISERRIRDRSIMEGWPYHKIKAYGDKRKRKYFQIEDLPTDIRVKVIQALNSDYQKNVILPQRADLSVSESESLIHQWNEAPLWKRREAEARLEILTAWNRFSKEGGRKRAADRFSGEYGIRNRNLGISPETFERVKSISRASLYNYRKAYRRYGLIGLFHRGKGKPGGVWTLDMETFLRGLLGKNPDIRAIRAWDHISNKFAGPGVAIPSKRTIRTKLTELKERDKSAYTFLENPDQWRSEFQLALGDASEKAKHFLHIMEFDSTPADVLTSDGKRNTIIGGIDIFCRKAKLLVAPTSKATAIAALMRSIILDWGLFDVMVTDKGKEYVSTDVQVACHALGISLEPTLAFSPELKAFIERFFRSLSMGLFEELSGYIGNNQAKRKAIESRKSFAQRFMKKGEVIEVGLTTTELQAFCNTWLEHIYHQRVHRSLGKSPEAKAAESTQPVRKISDPRLLDLLLAPVGYPTVQKKGIQYHNSFYIAPELGDYVKQKVEIRLDLQKAGRIYVFEKDTRRFICIAEDASISGLTVAEINEARNAQKKKVREKVKALKALAKTVGDPMIELLESKRNEPGQVRAFHRTEEATGGMIEETKKALKAQDASIEEFTPELEDRPRDEAERSLKVVSLSKRPEFFYSSRERYKWLMSQGDSQITDRDRDWMERYEGTLEYYRIFKMSHENQEGGAK